MSLPLLTLLKTQSDGQKLVKHLQYSPLPAKHTTQVCWDDRNQDTTEQLTEKQMKEASFAGVPFDPAPPCGRRVYTDRRTRRQGA